LLLLKKREIDLILNLCAHENIGKIIFFIKLKFIIGVATLLCIHAGAFDLLCGVVFIPFVLNSKIHF
jgi:hypothetical protein